MNSIKLNRRTIKGLTEMVQPKAPVVSDLNSALDDQYTWFATIAGLVGIVALTAVLTPPIKRHIREAREESIWRSKMDHEDREMAKLIAQMERESERSKQIAREIQAIKAQKVAR